MNKSLDELLASLKDLNPSEKEKLAEEVKEIDETLLEKEIERASKDCLFFVKRFVFTLDEHDKKNPIKRFPNKEYLWDMVNLFLNERLLLLEKSRQVMVTWTIISCCLWEAMFHSAQRIFVQSKKEQDADELVKRAKFIYNHLPDKMKQMYPVKQPMAYLKLEFPKWHSIIQGTPQGPDILRQYTASRVVMDEAAFQEKGLDAYMASKPTLEGGGSIVIVSSPNGKNWFYLLAKDKV